MSGGLPLPVKKRMRKVASELIGDNLEAELAPMSSSHKDGEVIKDVPIAFIPCLWKIEDLLKVVMTREGKHKSTQTDQLFITSYTT